MASPQSLSGGGLEIEIGADASEFNAVMQSIAARTQAAAEKVQAAGRKMTMALTGPIAGGAAAAVKAFADFDQAMTESLAIMDDVSAGMESKMSQAAKEVAATTQSSATEAAESYFFLASAGLDAQQSLEALPQVAKFAQAGMFSMEEATDLLTDAQSALGLSSEDAAENMQNMKEVSDVLVSANQQANASVQQFSEALTNRAAAALRTANKSMEEGVAILSAFADQGIKGRRAGMQLSRILRILSQSASENTEEFRQLGLIDTEGNLASLSEVVRSMSKDLRGMSDSQKSARLEQLGFTARVQQAIKPLLGMSDQIKTYEQNLRNAGGATNEVASNQMKSFTAQMGLLWDQVKNVGITIGGTLAPVIQRLTQNLKGALDSIQAMNEETRAWWMAVLSLSAALGPVLFALGKFGSLISSILSGVGALVGFLSTLAGVFTSLGAAFVGVVGVMISRWDQFQSYFGEILSGIKQMFGAAGTFIRATWTRLMGLMRQAVKALAEETFGLFGDIAAFASKMGVAAAKPWAAAFKSMEGSAKQWQAQNDKAVERAAQNAESAASRFAFAFAKSFGRINTMNQKFATEAKAVWSDTVDFLQGKFESLQQVFIGGAGGTSQNQQQGGGQNQQRTGREGGGEVQAAGRTGQPRSLQNMVRNVERAGPSMSRLNERVNEAKLNLQMMGQEGSKAGRFVASQMRSLSQQMATAIMQAGGIGEAFKSMGKTVINALTGVIAKLTTAVALSGILTAVTGGGFAGMQGFGGILSGLIGLSGGGFVKDGPMPAMLHGNEAVIPLDRMSEMGGGMPSSFEAHIVGGIDNLRVRLQQSEQLSNS